MYHSLRNLAIKLNRIKGNNYTKYNMSFECRQYKQIEITSNVCLKIQTLWRFGDITYFSLTAANIKADFREGILPIVSFKMQLTMSFILFEDVVP